jgi:hypothetical protein
VMVVEDFLSEVFGKLPAFFLFIYFEFFSFSRRKIEYKCKGDSTCQVDVNRRNQCQACRFQRCLQMKMKPNGENIHTHHHTY